MTVAQDRDEVMLESVKEYIDSRDSIVEQKIRLWIITSVLVNIVALVPVIFLLGGLYQNGTAALDLLKQDRIDIADSKAWHTHAEKRELKLEMRVADLEKQLNK